MMEIKALLEKEFPDVKIEISGKKLAIAETILVVDCRPGFIIIDNQWCKSCDDTEELISILKDSIEVQNRINEDIARLRNYLNDLNVEVSIQNIGSWIELSFQDYRLLLFKYKWHKVGCSSDSENRYHVRSEVLQKLLTEIGINDKLRRHYLQQEHLAEIDNGDNLVLIVITIINQQTELPR